MAIQLGLKSVEVIPVSALAGDNVVERSATMGWYSGPTLLEYLETVPLTIREAADGPLRFPVQLVVRPNAEFRGFAGRVERGEVRPGMRVKALPSGRVTTVKSIVTYDGELPAASFPLSVTVELEDEIDLSRGEMLVGEDQSAPHLSTGVSRDGGLDARAAVGCRANVSCETYDAHGSGNGAKDSSMESISNRRSSAIVRSCR